MKLISIGLFLLADLLDHDLGLLLGGGGIQHVVNAAILLLGRDLLVLGKQEGGYCGREKSFEALCHIHFEFFCYILYVWIRSKCLSKCRGGPIYFF